MLGAVYLQAGEVTRGDSTSSRSAAKLDSTSTQTLGLLGYAYAKSGNAARATAIAKSLETRIGKVSGAAPLRRASISGSATTVARSSLLERAAADHDSFYSSESLSESFFDPIRADPRFAAIVATVGLDRRVLNP